MAIAIADVLRPMCSNSSPLRRPERLWIPSIPQCERAVSYSLSESLSLPVIGHGEIRRALQLLVRSSESIDGGSGHSRVSMSVGFPRSIISVQTRSLSSTDIVPELDYA